jgi:hypothetical protein
MIASSGDVWESYSGLTLPVQPLAAFCQSAGTRVSCRPGFLPGLLLPFRVLSG